MTETIIVSTIVGGVLILAGRSFYRTLSGKNTGCGCGSKTCTTSSHCSLSEVLRKGDKRQQ
ncbi:FeoB-associated Cys-rich membrane protein [Desulfobacterium sp. N47]|uniref:FeoB-associated Cys-rich membrane protein n=1 Tax=Desulfobacterium sp. N47 TaxID=3115210 RepID=UPI003F4A0357